MFVRREWRESYMGYTWMYIYINNVLLHNIGPDLSCEKGRMIRVRV